MNHAAQSPSRPPTKYETISFDSASRAVQVHASPFMLERQAPIVSFRSSSRRLFKASEMSRATSVAASFGVFLPLRGRINSTSRSVAGVRVPLSDNFRCISVSMHPGVFPIKEISILFNIKVVLPFNPYESITF